jgi:surface protein
MKNIACLLFISIIIQGCGESNSGSSSFTTGSQAPVIDAKESYNIPENRQKAFDIKATDKTLLTYFIAGQDAKDFHVDILTGEVVFRNTPDFETKSQYKLTVVVEDTVKNRSEQNVTLNIIDVDESTIPVINESTKSTPFSEPNSDKYFITRWKTDNEGESNSKQIKIPTLGDDYNYSVDWGDGTSTIGITGDIIHDYNIEGTYTVKINGDFPRISFSKNHEKSDAKKLVSIEQWGKIEWKSMAGSFDGCSNMVGNSRDKPNLSKVTNMEYMFLGATKFNEDIGAWDVSSITNMLCLFGASSSFNQDIGGWNVSNVTNMVGLFFGASKFNQDLTAWNVSKVTDMNSAFFKAGAFNGNVTGWNVEKVTNMNNMFSQASKFNQDIGTWNVSNVQDMAGMFFKATSFNQNLADWDVSKVTNMDGMFTETTSLDKRPLWFKENK